jgi:hypothetical protein
MSPSRRSSACRSATRRSSAKPECQIDINIIIFNNSHHSELMFLGLSQKKITILSNSEMSLKN